MKIQVEILYKNIDNQGFESWIVDKSKVIVFTTGTKTQKISNAKSKLLELKKSLPENQKLRVLEYHNDESDETRQPCKILFES